MCRPVTRTLLVLSCSLFLGTTSGCSLFRADLSDAYMAAPPQHLPEVAAPAPADPPREDSQAAAPKEPIPFAQTSAAAAVTATKPAAEGDTASCFIEIRALNKDPRRIRMSLEDAAYVQKVLEQTGLVKDFRQMTITLSRKLPNGGRHKLDVHYDTKKNQVVTAFDYTLHPNDLLVIQEESQTSFDEMLKKLAGPLAR